MVDIDKYSVLSSDNDAEFNWIVNKIYIASD